MTDNDGRADTPIARMRRMTDALACGRLPATADRSWFVAQFQNYQTDCEAGISFSFDRHLGLTGHGRNGWWTVEALARRNHLIRELHRRHFPHLDCGQAARHIAALAGKHNASRFGQQRTLGRDPDGVEALLHAALCTTHIFPAVKQLKTILGKS